MNHVNDGKYYLALSILNNLIGSSFSDFRVEEKKPKSNAEQVDRLKVKFHDLYRQREYLRSADDAALQAIIDDLGPLPHKPSHIKH